MDSISKIKTEIQESIAVKQTLLENETLIDSIAAAADCMIRTLSQNGKILICGNGGSASDALHMAGELVGRFQKERKAYFAVALNADVATMTAAANDYGYDCVFSRQVEGLMRREDVLVGITTSGDSGNVLRAMEKAKEIGGKTVLLSGRSGGKCRDVSDISVIIPSEVTAHIQEAHECIYHIWCGLIEESIS